MKGLENPPYMAMHQGRAQRTFYTPKVSIRDEHHKEALR